MRRRQAARERGGDGEDAESSQESVSYNGERQNGGGSTGAQVRCLCRTLPAFWRYAETPCTTATVRLQFDAAEGARQ